MNHRILNDPAFGLGLVVWLVAASVFPLQLGLSGASAVSFVGYLLFAGVLLAVADAILNAQLYRGVSDVALQAVFWLIGLSVPAAIAFAVGTAVSPAREAFEDDLCRISGVIVPHDASEGSLMEALDPTESCEAIG
jgi:predicted outer membrane lipoprotein